MKFSEKFFFSLGLLSIFLGIPLTQIIANNNNFLIANNYFKEITFFLIILTIFSKFIYDHYIATKIKYLSILLTLFFFQVINVYLIKYSEYIFNDISRIKQISFYLFLILIFTFISIIINKK